MEVKKHRKANPLKAEIHMPEGVWTYRITSAGATIRNPEGNITAKIDMPELTGWSWNDLERQEWKGCPMPEIKPSDIRSLIERINAGEFEIIETNRVAKKPKKTTRKNNGKSHSDRASKNRRGRVCLS